MDTETASVVVGMKHLVADASALRLAAREAAWSGSRLRVVHAFTWPVFGSPGDDRERDENTVERAAAHARAMFPGLAATAEVIDGAPIPVLLRAASEASLLVLGSSGLARSWAEPLESVSVQVAVRATAPVLFARGVDRPGPVVAGVDGLIEESRAAQLVVVGGQGDRPTLLGPATQTVLRHAYCPVLVAHARLVPEPARKANQLLAR
ncbi:universal stress protein [Actinomycetes bacterium KLBMP 9797]